MKKGYNYKSKNYIIVNKLIYPKLKISKADDCIIRDELGITKRRVLRRYMILYRFRFKIKDLIFSGICR